MLIKSDVPRVFREAIASGRLSSKVMGNPLHNDAVSYMYMYTDDDGVDQFKHIDTRRYL